MDQTLKIKSYQPDTPAYAARISNEQWEQHKSLLRHLHDEGKKRADMLEILHKQGFRPSLGQLNSKMTAWGFKVYGTQTDSSLHDAEILTQDSLSDHADAEMGDHLAFDLVPSPSSQRSSSMTLCEPERQLNAAQKDRKISLDEVIILQGLELDNQYQLYQPMTKPSDFGFQVAFGGIRVDKSNYQSIVSVADFLYAVHCFEQAFDLYYQVFVHVISTDLVQHTSVVKSLMQCAISATTDAQCSYVSSILRPAHAYCVEHAMTELTACFSSLIHELCTKDTTKDRGSTSSSADHLTRTPLLIAIGAHTESVMHGKEWLQQQLSECDEACGTLLHLSRWCQDTISYFRLERQPIVAASSQTPFGKANGVAAIEHDFQALVAALTIDFLNSPGPSMGRANVDCKNRDCLFRWTLSPSTSLIVMAYLLYEPMKLQTQSITNAYLLGRAQHFSIAKMTTALAELKSFATTNSSTRCGAFVETFMRHFNTTLAFRRIVSNVTCSWDRMAAAKRLAQVLQSNQTGLLPHAGLPSARRSVFKTMVAPFPHDPSFTESRPSMVSESGSMREFERLARQVGLNNAATGTSTPSDAMSIDTRSSWSFHRVTGFTNGLLSGRNSLSSRKGDPEETGEYRKFIKDSNYSQ